MKSSTQPPFAGTALIAEVRYSLPDLLREVQLERNSAVFTMEKLDKAEIEKIFQKPRPRRAVKNRQS